MCNGATVLVMKWVCFLGVAIAAWETPHPHPYSHPYPRVLEHSSSYLSASSELEALYSAGVLSMRR